MAKNLQVNLAFTADTNAAMQNLQTLRNSLNEISSLPFSVGKGLNSDLQIAANSASQLQKHLGAAMDVKTGNLNLNKLQSSLQQSNQSLSQLTSGLLRAGTTGEKAFLATYSAIAQSNLQLKQSNTLLSQFALTMKNTVKWQLSSSLLHGLISGFNQAIDYAKDLNTSLNNIQIVTGQSSEQMAEFAKQANKAAKELRSTTVAYTDAALIYYQQGLEGKAVTDRANTTVKLANVTGESAETVSQWMTAVWNNFDNGSKSLEYYADVMTALGAATASSSDEIAQGLEKFVAVADTVGLSYESATAALATITATTRQSADVVGTALKTLFARVQDLDLGKTLEDGTTLGSYSDALYKVGINIKDANGQLKDMDIILDEMGTKWKQLDKDQQVALAKNVAGIRQYTQLIALMDNYDFYKQNQSIASGAEGTLTEQAEIYEQSWEAASKKAKTSLESMYNVLIPTDFIVDFTNGLADVVSGFTDILDAAGGLKTILLLISSVVLTKFQTQIASALDTGIIKTKTLIENTRTYAQKNGGAVGMAKKMLTAATGGPIQTETQKRTNLMNKEATGMQAQYQEGLTNSLNMKTSSGQPLPLSESFVIQVKSYQEIAQYSTKILNLKNKMTQAEFEQMQLQQQQLKALGEERAANIEKIEDLKMQLDILKEQQNAQFNRKDFEPLSQNSDRVLSYDDTMSLNADEQTGLKLAAQAATAVVGQKTDVDVEATSTGGLTEFANLETAKAAQIEILEVVSNTKQAELEIQQILDNKPDTQDITVEKENQFKAAIQETLQSLVENHKLTTDQANEITKEITGYETIEELTAKIQAKIKGISSGAQAAAKVMKVSETAIKGSVENAVKLYQANNKNNQLLSQSAEITKQIDEALNKVVNKGESLGTKLVKGIQGFSQMAMGINMLTSAVSSLGQAFEDGFDFSALLSGIASLGMALPMVISSFKTVVTTLGFLNGYILINTAITEANNIAKEAGIALDTKEAAAIRGTAIARALGITAELTEKQIQDLGNISKTKAIALSVAMKAAKLLEALGIGTNTAAMIADTVATGSAAAATWALIWPIGVLMLAVAALALVIWGIVSAFQAMAANTPEAKLAALEEKAEKSKEAMNAAAEAVKDLTSSLEGLKDSYKSFETLEKGTNEWLLKVMEVNEQVTDLLKKYPELEKYVNWDKGYAELSEEGMQVAQQLANKDLVTKTNIYNENQIAIKKQKQNMLNDDYGYVDTYTVQVPDTITLNGYTNETGTYHTETRSEYKTTNLGDGASAAEYARHAFGVDVQDLTNEEDLAKLYEKKKELVGSEKEAIEEFLDDYEEHLRLQNQINNLDNQQLVSRGQQAGSTRNAEELKKIMGINSYDDIQKSARDKVEKQFGYWNDHFNYNIDNDAEGDMIKDFMKLQGEDTKYVAQRHENMVLEIDGEEVEFTKDEVYDQLTELYSGEEFETKLKEGLQTSIGTALGGVDLSNLDLPTLNALDEIKRGFDETFSGLNLNAEQTNQKFQELVGIYSTVENGNIIFDAEQLAQDSEFIDTTSDKFQDLTQRFAEGTIGAQEFTTAMREMNAEGQLDSMTEFFNTAAEGMGLGEEEATDMQNYAKHLAEIAKSSDELSDTLVEDAESAADLAIEITKMNKGIDELADGFEDWSDILKKSSNTSAEYAKAMNSIKSSLAKVLDVEEDLLSSDFVNTHLEEIEKAAQGDEKAIDNLRAAMDEEIIQNIILTSPDELGNQIKELDSKLRSDLEALNAEIPDLEVGMVLTGATEAEKQFIETADRMVKEAGMTADEANAYFAGMGYEPIIEQTDIEDATTQEIPESRTTTTVKSIGFSKENMTIMGKEVGFIKAPQLVTETKVESTSSKPSKGNARVFGFSGGAKKPTGAKIVGFKKKAGGSSSNYSSKNSGGSSPGSSSKSSGGSSSKTAAKDKLDIFDEGDFYHDINREIERLADNTERLADAKDRAFGDDKINLINQEIKAVQAEVKAQEKLIERAKQKLEIDKKALKTYDATYNKNGEITNYDQMLQNEINKYNAAVDAYNAKAAQKDAGTLSDEAWEAAEKAFEAAEERYSGFEEAISTYEADLDIKEDAVEEAAAKAREILDLQLEGIQYGVDVQIEVNDRDLKVLERLLERLDDDLYDGASRISNMTKQMNEQFDNIEIYKAGIRQTLVSAGADQAAVDAYMAGDSKAVQGLDLTEEQMKMLQDYTDGIMESEDAILELREEIENQTMITFDAWHEKIEKNGQVFEYATSMAESYKNIIDLVGKTRLNIDDSVLKDLENTQMSAANGAMQNAKAQMDTTQSALDNAKAQLQKAKARGNKDDIEKWEKDIETLNETLMADQEAFMSSWETALQTAADIFTAQMDRAFENLEDDLAGTFKSFDELNAAMDRQQQAADRFMDAGKKQYELSKLNRKLQQDLDKTDSTKAQKELLKLQKEIEAYQENGVEMSERDLTALQKKYELKVAEIALEDAQNAKSQVRLTRDSEGNFGYVYTADESQVANAQQNYEDKLEENRQLAIEQNKQLSEAIVANRQAMVEALREIRQEDYADTEAYMQALQETTQFYKEQEAYLIEETQKVIERSQDIYTNDYLAYDNWSTQKTDRGNAYYEAMEARQDAANEIEKLKASGQWDKLSEKQKAAYEEELRKADEQWLKLQNSQTTSYDVMGANADGWVSDQTLLMGTLGFNILEGVTKGADGSQGTNGLSAALGSAENGTGFFGESKAAAETWESNIDTIMGNAGIDISNIKGKADEGLGQNGAQKSFVDFKTAVTEALYGKGGSKAQPTDNSVNGAMNASKNKIDTLKTTAETQFGNVAIAVGTWQTTYSGKITTATTDTNNLNTAISNLLGKQIEVLARVKGQTDVDKLKETIDGLGDKTINIKNNTTNTITTEYKTKGDAPNSGTQGDGIPQVGDTVTFESGVYTADSYGGGASGSQGRGGAMKISLITNTNRARPYHLTTTSGGARGWVSLDQISGYDTGGYTGEWGPEGRLAMLHQKEIVLNASDTENLLMAVQMIRDISGQLEANAMTMKYIKTLENYGAKVNVGGQTLQQDVIIHAEFPNATNHNEIEEAFKNLTTLASQYTNRKS